MASDLDDLRTRAEQWLADCEHGKGCTACALVRALLAALTQLRTERPPSIWSGMTLGLTADGDAIITLQDDDKAWRLASQPPQEG